MTETTKIDYDEMLKLAECLQNDLVLIDVYDQFASRIPSGGIHIDVGHRKNLNFPRKMAAIMERMFPEKQFVYYDGSDPHALERFELSIAVGVGKRRRKLSPNLRITNNPAEYKNSADSISHFFTIHEFDSQKDALAEAYSLLRKEDSRENGGLNFIVDYDLSWVREELDRIADSMVRIFNKDGEIKVTHEEPDWISKHSFYSLDQCVKDAESVGYKTVHSQVFGNKLFLYVGKK